jgi:hypothetical protein
MCRLVSPSLSNSSCPSTENGHSVSTYHFDCMPGDVKKELIKKLEGDHIAAYPLPPPDATNDDPPSTRPRRRKIETERLGSLKIDLCPNCKRKGGSRCYACGVSGVKPIVVDPKAMVVDGEKVIVEKPALMFRCKKSVHVSFLSPPFTHVSSQMQTTSPLRLSPPRRRHHADARSTCRVVLCR